MSGSRHYRRAPLGWGAPAGPDDLARWLATLPLERAVLIPCQDHWVRAIAALDASARARFAASTPALSVVDIFLDKERLLETLERHDIPRPVTVRVESEADLAAIARWPNSTWFLKPKDSQAFRARFRVKAMQVASLDDAAERYRAIRDAGLEIVLQEYVPGPASAHWFVDGFVDRAGTVRAVFARQRIRMYPTDFGDSSFMLSRPIEEAGPAVEALTRLVRAVGHRGIFSGEFKQDPRDDAFRLIDVNVRPWAYVEFATACGINTPQMAYHDALERDVTDVTAYPTGRAFGVFTKDVRAFAALRREGAIGTFDWLGSWIRAKDAVFRLSDPGAGWGQVFGRSPVRSPQSPAKR